MKNLNEVIFEKLVINKNSKSKLSTYKFDHIKLNFSINLPFKFYFPEINKTAEIYEIEFGSNEYEEPIWRFYEKDTEELSDKGRLQVVQLSIMGIKNVFIKGPQNNYATISQPLVFNINGLHVGKRLKIQLEDPKTTIIKESINEKLVINKYSKSINTYTFKPKNNEQTNTKYIDGLTIKLPFNIIIDNKKTISIEHIKYTSEYGFDSWEFYDKNNKNVMGATQAGIRNLFVDNIQCKFYIYNSFETFPVKLDNGNYVIRNEHKISEKLILTKNSKKANNIYWFTNNKGIKLPFELTIPEINETITITRIEHTKAIKKNLWKLYDENDNHVFTLYDLVLNTLLFNNSNRHVAILRTFDNNLKHKVRNPDSIIVHYKDDKDKILKESINESADEQKRFSNIIILSPEEDEVLILRRANYMKKFKGMYGFPGGSIDQKDKDSKSAAIRELKEETGIELTWNEEHKCKKYDSIKNNDGSISDYWITTLETKPEVKLSKEHSVYEWFNENSDKKHKWMPNVFQIIQKIL